MATGPISYAFFVGDVHLDERHPDRENAFCRLLEMIRHERPDHVFLMGDIFEFWFGYRNTMFSKFIKPISKIANLTDQGIPVTYLVGNHDFKPGPVFEKLLNTKVELNPVRLKLGSHLVYLAHGDEINSSDSGYRFIRAVFRNRLAQFLFQHLVPISLAYYIGRGTSDSSRKFSGHRERPIPDAIFQEFCRREQANQVNVIIHGHNHDPGERIWENDGYLIKIIDSGDWLGEKGHYVVFKDDMFQCRNWNF